MPKKSMRSRSRSRRGGIWPFDSDTQDSSSTGSSWYSNLNPFGSKKPEYGSTAYGSTSNGMGMGMDNSQQPYNTGYGMGGKKGKRRRSMRGGYSDNISLNNLASTAEPISGVPTASAHQYVGGRTRRRRRHRHNKSCKHRKH
jgi:hypothetical protein